MVDGVTRPQARLEPTVLANKEMVPLNPLFPVTVMIETAVEPVATGAGDVAVMVKSASKVKIMNVVCDSDPLVPVIDRG